MESRRRVLPGFLAVIVFAFALYWLMISIEPWRLVHQWLFGYQAWQKEALSNPVYRFLWLIGDMTEPQFHKSLIGGIGLLLFACFAYILDRSGSKWKGFSICYGTGLWPWVLMASLIGLFLSVYLYGRNLSQGWVPTFVPFVSVPAGVVLVYGGGWKNTLTGGILGAIFTFPIAWLIIEKILTPWGLPALSGNVTGMWLGGIIVFEICNCLPWMKRPQPQEDTNTAHKDEVNKKALLGSGWFIRRVLADFSESHFYGNEIASVGLIIGSFLSWLLNPLHPAYGSGVFPALLLSQFLTAAIGIFLYYDHWQGLGWYPTFVPVVSVAPAIVLLFGGSMQSILAGAVLGAIAGPPVARLVIRNVPKHWHPFIGNTFSMALCTAVIAAMLKYLPGFGISF